MSTFLIAGLGNPGTEYEKTRHNIGFMAIDQLAKKHGISIQRLQSKALVGDGRIGEHKVILVKPQTFMNASGEAIGELARYYRIEHDHILVLVDDIDIHLGSLRIRPDGSAGTHNGLKSVIAKLPGTDFPRIRISAGRKPAYMDLADFVLSPFYADEIKILEEELKAAVSATEEFLCHGEEEAMNQWNGWIAPSVESYPPEKKEQIMKNEMLREKEAVIRRNAKSCKEETRSKE